MAPVIIGILVVLVLLLFGIVSVLTHRLKGAEAVLAWVDQRDPLIASLYVNAVAASQAQGGSRRSAVIQCGLGSPPNWIPSKPGVELLTLYFNELISTEGNLRRAADAVRRWESTHPVPDRPEGM